MKIDAERSCQSAHYWKPQEDESQNARVDEVVTGDCLSAQGQSSENSQRLSSWSNWSDNIIEFF